VSRESPSQRRQREGKRTLFDGIAGQYDATRQGYPDRIVRTLLTTAGLRSGSSVLEIGCGTGQLTRQLAERGLKIRAIDIGAAMVRTASQNVLDPDVSFAVSSFEAYEPAESCDLIVSATGFHWVDPEVGWTKAAGLLQPSGWLALLVTGEAYTEPLRAAVHKLWVKFSPTGAEWLPSPPWAQTMRESGLFGAVVEASHTQALSLPAETVLGVETTRATYLSYDPPRQRSFAADLERLLRPTPTVELTQETSLVMASVRPLGYPD
jgi:trans-aconitate methyltransferase